ncbi:hypothetical protein PM082_000282 [Marasmius tenuissimus]|nr:hypothetical protein PM082_000282 [Marasmius tenuissimus]
MRFNIFLVGFSAASALTLAAPYKRDTATIKADIDGIRSAGIDADVALIRVFSPDRFGASLDFRNTIIRLDTSVQTATSDTQATPAFSQTDGEDILNRVTEVFQPTLIDLLSKIVVKKPAFDALPVGNFPALMLQDLKNLNTHTTNFADALITKSPASLVTRFAQFKNIMVEPVFASAIAAYSRTHLPRES